MPKTLFWWLATLLCIVAIIAAAFGLCGITKNGLVQTNWLWLGPMITAIAAGWFSACRADESSFEAAY